MQLVAEEILSVFKTHLLDHDALDSFQRIKAATILVVEHINTEMDELNDSDKQKFSQIFFTAVSRIDDRLTENEAIIKNFQTNLDDEFANHFPDSEESDSMRFRF